MPYGDIIVVTPSIPVRSSMLGEASLSVIQQKVRPVAHHVIMDLRGDGSAITRNRGLFGVDTEWVAFLDDDDRLYPQHLLRLLEHANETGADVVYPWFTSTEDWDPHHALGVPFDAERLEKENYIPMTALVRTQLAQEVGGCAMPGDDDYLSYPDEIADDWTLWKRLLKHGATFAHVPEQTWHFRRHHSQLRGHSWTRGGEEWQLVPTGEPQTPVASD